MYARITQFEIDTLRIAMSDALQRFQELVLPELRNQPGYQGIWVMETSEGKGVLLTLWQTEEAARASLESGFYDQQVEKFVMFTRQPPGRDHYRVTFSELPPLDAGVAEDESA
jgi:hypothetical protein